MAEAAVEGVEAAAPELEAAGAKAVGEAKQVGSSLLHKIERAAPAAAAPAAVAPAAEIAIAPAAAAAPAAGATMTRLLDIGTGVAIGQSLGHGDQKGAQAAQAATQTLAAAQQPPGAPVAGAAEARRRAAQRTRDGKGRFVKGGNRPSSSSSSSSSSSDELEGPVGPIPAESGGRERFRPVHGGDGPTIVIQPRPLAEKMQIAVLIVLVLVIIAAVVYITVRRPGVHAAFGLGMALGISTGAALVWALRSRTKSG